MALAFVGLQFGQALISDRSLDPLNRHFRLPLICPCRHRPIPTLLRTKFKADGIFMVTPIRSGQASLVTFYGECQPLNHLSSFLPLSFFFFQTSLILSSSACPHTSGLLFSFPSFLPSFLLFLDASTHLYKRLCPSVGPWVTRFSNIVEMGS